MNGLLLTVLTAALFAIVGIIFSLRKTIRTEEYILSRNTLGSGGLSLTIFASGMGSWILFGPAEALLTAGVIALIGYALSSTLSLWMFGLLGAKMREIFPEGKSLTEFVLERFGKGMYLLVLLVSFVYMALAMTAELSGIGLAGGIVFGIPAWQTILILGLATLSYTFLGGFQASVFTDKVQSLIILLLFAVLVIASISLMGAFDSSVAISHIPPFGSLGVEYAIALIIGVVSAEAFNQMWWQRVYSAKNVTAMRRGFVMAGCMVFPMVMIAGLLGVYALHADAAVAPSAALFSFISTLPPWLLGMAMVFATTLMMSTMDSLLNAMVSIVTIDIRRLWTTLSEKTLLLIARGLTLIFAFGIMAVATQGLSVLYLFLIADLICAGAAFPVFYGMFSKKVSKNIALLASASGILAGLLLFPDPEFTRGSLMWSFILAFSIPVFITLLFEKNGTKIEV